MPLLAVGISLLLAASGALWLVARRGAQENVAAAASAADSDLVVLVAVGLHSAAFAAGFGFVFAGLVGAEF